MEARTGWVLEWLRMLLEGVPNETDFDSGLGCLSFFCNAIVHDRPFLAPLYSLAAEVRMRTGGKVDFLRLHPLREGLPLPPLRKAKG